MWPRARIDIGWADLGYAAAHCLFSDRSRAREQAEDRWSDDGTALACLSVRSGLDLLLAAMDWPAETEILMSAINIGGMVRVIEHHGLKIVAVDLNHVDAAIREDLLESLVTPRTKAIVIAQLLGGRADLSSVVAFAQRHQLLVIEDCAQAFAGSAYRGHDAADVSLFSFGPIKTATALGGAMLRVRDPQLRQRMQHIQRRYPVQSRLAYLRRIGFYSVLKFLGIRFVFRAFVAGCQWLGRDLEQTLNGSVRNFPGADFIGRLRQQPCAALLRLMTRRFSGEVDTRIARRAALGRLLASRLSARATVSDWAHNSLRCPGCLAENHVFWLFPVQVDQPQRVLEQLQQHGFDATQGNALRAVTRANPEHVTVAAVMLDDAIYLPIYADLPETEVQRMADCLLAATQVAPETTPAPEVSPRSADTAAPRP